VVDVLGLDFYFGKGDDAEIAKLAERLRHVTRAAQARGKLAALAETGDRMGWDETEMLEIDRWYTRCLLAALTADEQTRRISYALVWRNGHPRHCFVPYPGHPALPDFLTFRQDPFIRFLGDPDGAPAPAFVP
jgi:mannan endo-1,4-beta-mannosidase